jgi:acyl-CoA thioesterase I
MKNKKYTYIGFIVLAIIFGLSTFVYINRPVQKTVTEVQTLPSLASTTIIAFGDSLTAGYGLPLSESYPAQLENLLIKNSYSLRVINAGVSGETSRGNNERAAFIRKQNPEIVILGVGGNDALRGLSIEELKKNISSTIEILQSGQNPPKILLLAMQSPQNAGPEYKKSFDSLYIKVAEQYNLTKVDFIQPEVFLQKDLLLADGIHPTKEGYAIIVEKYIYPAVKELLEKQ